MASLVLKANSSTDYYSKTTNRKTGILVDGRTMFISNVLSVGNSKLANNILIFDMLAGTTCKNNSQCIKSCYAMKAQRQYPDTFNKRAINTWLAEYDLATLENLIVSQLKKTKKPYVRIHSSGDFISQQYIDMWERVIIENPDKEFYCYTKVYDMFNFSQIEKLKNFNIVQSFLPDGDKNYGKQDFIDEKTKKYPNIVVCPYGIEEDVTCGESCTHCLHNEYVVFLQH